MIISGADVLNRAKERAIPLLANAWDIFINWQFLQSIKLDFLGGVIWEDVLFAELLFAQCERILVLPQDLSNYRVRVDSTQNFANFTQKVLPPFVSPLQKHFSDANSAWVYFSAFSWVSIAEQFSRFCETHKNTQIAKMLIECYLRHLLVEGSAIMECENDPNGAKKVFLKLAVKWGKKYLPPKKRQFAYNENSLAWKVYRFCAYLVEVERKFRRWRKSKFKKV